MTPESIAERLARIGYRITRDGVGEQSAALLRPGDGRWHRVVKRIHLWQQDGEAVAYAIEFAPIRLFQGLGVALCVAGIAMTQFRLTFWCVWLLAIGLPLLAMPEAILALARQSTREDLEWAARFPRLPPPRREHPAVSFPAA